MNRRARLGGRDLLQRKEGKHSEECPARGCASDCDTRKTCVKFQDPSLQRMDQRADSDKLKGTDNQ